MKLSCRVKVSLMRFLGRSERSKMVRNSVFFNSGRIARSVGRDPSWKITNSLGNFVDVVLALCGGAKVVPSVVSPIAINMIDLMWRPFASHVENGKTVRWVLATIQPYPKHIMDWIVASGDVPNLAVPSTSLAGPAPENSSLRLIGQKFLQPPVRQHLRLSSIPGV
jgi:hypothetical protein